MDGKQLQSQYKDHLSDFQNWDQRAHAQEYILYPKNMGYHLCIDETALSKGDLYTILINRDKRGRKGSIIAVIQGTKTDDIIAVLTKMPQELRNQVKEITLDMAGSMQKIAKTCFPRAMQVIDRFHVQKLVYEAVQELRITYRWQVIKEENKAMKAAEAAIDEETQKEATEELNAEEKVNKELAEAQKTIEEQHDKYLRLSAEFDNYRKRTMKEKAELIKNGGEKAITAILPILDDLERAVKTSETSDDVKAMREGIELIYNKFLKVLNQEGLQKIETDGENFDTDYHEAIALVPAPSEEKKGKILDCVQTGYKLNDKVIRHAKVVVAQ